MNDQSGSKNEELNTANSESEGETDALDPAAQDEIRERVTKLAFAGDPAQFEEFLSVLNEATPRDADVILRGSAITGHKHGTDEPFDADGPGTSDLDVTFVGGDMVKLYNEFHIPGIHSVPFGEDHPDACPELAPMRKRLCEMTGRPVNIQATTSFVQYMRDVVMEQPYLVLIKNRESDD